jgi:hypothetical protein
MKRAALLLSAALIVASPAFAQSNSQYNAGDATAVTEIEVGETYDAAATSVASGNAVSVVADDATATMLNDQHMDGDTTSTTDATVWDADGNVVAASASVANGATAVLSNSEVDIDSLQRAHGDSTATTTFTGGDAENAATSASASSNVLSLSAEYSELRVLADQESTGSVTANVEADHCCIAGQVVSGAVASANNLTIGSETATVLTDVRQTATGDSVSARVDLYSGYAYDASGNATANANSVTVDNQWGYVNARIDQQSTANVSADSYVTLGGDFIGFGSAGAYGVGNQAIVANVGSDTAMETIQANSGDISANAALAGSGGDALASSAAYGNSVTGSLCGDCDTNVPSLVAYNDQTNDGNVSSSARVVAPYARNVAASATAIGNAATYQVTGPAGN